MARAGVPGARCSSSISTRSPATPRDRGRRAAGAARRRRRSPASAGSTGSTTTWCAPTRSTCPGMGAGVVRIKGTDRALAMSVDGNGRYCYLDPYRGAMLAVAEAARNVACAGARPLGRDQLPELRQSRAARRSCGSSRRRSKASARRAARSTCRSPAATSASTTRPTARRSIPTPVIGIVGLLEHADRVRQPRASSESGDVDRAARRRPRRARRQRVPEGRARSGARRAAGARSRRRARAAGAARRRWPPRG